MNKEEIINILRKLNLIEDEYCILGSASLVIRNLKDIANDIDILNLIFQFEYHQ